MTLKDKNIEKRSNWWYLLPILITWIGGVIGYFAVRRDDPALAKRVLILGIILTGAWIAIPIIAGVVH